MYDGITVYLSPMPLLVKTIRRWLSKGDAWEAEGCRRREHKAGI
jgi:hypothetical protein